MSDHSVKTWFCALLLTVSGSSALAQTAAQSARPAALEELAACRIVAVDAERLACFDRVVAAFDQAEQAGEVMVVERRQVTEARRALFGFSLEALPLFQRGAEPDRIDEIETTLARASAGANGKWLFVLADDSVWVQTDSNSLVRPPRPGSEISIRQAAMGSYLLSVNGARSVRVRRQQ